MEKADKKMATAARSAIISGGGVGGMAAAIELAKRGWSVTLVEADPEWRAYGAGITVTGPTYRAFRTLGILPQLAAEGFFVAHGSRICAADGEIMHDLAEEPLETDLPVVGGIMRPVLHATLAGQVQALGVRVLLGQTISLIETIIDDVHIILSNGERVKADLLIGADGMFSVLRKELFPDTSEPVYTGQYCWRVLAHRVEQIDRAHFFVGADIVAGLMPVSDATMYMWLLDRQSKQTFVEEGTEADQLRALMAPFSGVMGCVRDAIGPESSINVRPLFAHLIRGQWHRNRAVLIGDAAHGTTPHLASGAGMAVEDALVLAEELDLADTIEAAFDAFMQRRFERCRLVVDNSIAIGRMQQEGAAADKLGAMINESERALRQPI